MSDPTFHDVSTPVREADDAFAWTAPAGWLQGRATFGGLVLAAMTRAMEATAAQPDRRPRSLTAELAGPVQAGATRIRVERLREGRGVSTMSAKLEQNGETLVQASLALAKDRASDAPAPAVACPDAPDWRDVPAVAEDFPLTPEFMRHFEVRFLPPLPFSGEVAETFGYLRARRPGPARDAALVVAYADVWMPAIYTLFPAPRPMATVSFSLTFLAPLPEGDEPLLLRARALGVNDGFVAEVSELFDAAGRLVAVNHQTRAIIK